MYWAGNKFYARKSKLSRRKALGFTLLELLIVMVIMIGAVAIIGVEFSSAVDSARWKKDVWQMVTVLRAARDRAVTTGRIISLQSESASPNYQLSDHIEAQHLTENIQLQIQAGQWQPTTARQAALYFYPDGSSSGGSLQLESETQQATIEVDWLTGQVLLADAAP